MLIYQCPWVVHTPNYLLGNYWSKLKQADCRNLRTYRTLNLNFELKNVKILSMTSNKNDTLRISNHKKLNILSRLLYCKPVMSSDLRMCENAFLATLKHSV